MLGMDDREIDRLYDQHAAVAGATTGRPPISRRQFRRLVRELEVFGFRVAPRRVTSPLGWSRETWRAMWEWLYENARGEFDEHQGVSDLIMDAGHVSTYRIVRDQLNAGDLRNLGNDIAVMYAARAVELGFKPGREASETGTMGTPDKQAEHRANFERAMRAVEDPDFPVKLAAAVERDEHGEDDDKGVNPPDR